MRRISLRLPALLTGLAMLAIVSAAAAPKWETPKGERLDAHTVAKENDIEIKTASGLIIITSPRSLHVKVFTILGQTVSQETIPSGTSQLQLPAHGVYIIKIGDLACKVAI